ncbi:MAG: recombinase RecA [Bacteroidota bacterium]
MPNAPSKKEILQDTLIALEKKYGKGIIMTLSDEKIANLPALSTGSLGLDLALGIGGLPYGRILEVYGPESSGKTTLALHVIAEVQKKSGIAVLIDSEHAFDKSYAKSLGVNTDSLLITQPDDGEQGLEIADQLIKSGSINLVVVDSVAALVPRSELEGEISDHSVGTQARLMSKALRKLTGHIHKTGAICLFINQIRQKIGVAFGNPETTPGGNALKFYASVRVDIRKVAQIKQADKIIGHTIKAKVVKNKVAPPFKITHFDILYGKGINRLGEIIDLALSLSLITKSGAWISCNNERLGQGRQAAIEALEANVDLQKKLISQIKAKYLETF